MSHYFKSVAIRPGKPILFAKIQGKQKAIFGLPGNPMSSSACFRFFVYPFIANILGLEVEKPVKAVLKNDFLKKKQFTNDGDLALRVFQLVSVMDAGAHKHR